MRQFRFQYRRPFSRGLIQRYAPQGIGLEVGVGALTIAPVRRTILSDGFQDHASVGSIAQVYFKAEELPFEDSALDFILSEHVLEHLKNPVRVLTEWKRALKPEAILFLFLPHQGRTFDSDRTRTTLAHLIEHERHDDSHFDESHLDDWMKHVISRGRALHYSVIPIERHVELGLVHHHCWIAEDICELLQYLGFEVLEFNNLCPDRLDSFVVVAKKL